MNEKETLSFREKAPNFLKIEIKQEQTQSVEKEQEEKIPKTKIPQKESTKDEPMKLFFYYPKYLHPEAVALISQNLLNEWEEQEEKNV
jgi:hypothetical protein